ncbi:MAG: hypothetical protein QM809_13045 [Gordonia sp. (in: high G+C Gram-positive bacteria)]|uniref:hypothetical protein n=1 Tax=Gordonia sp. (in: high G+C Gram-positive bacteria) TaxID=84139 RepID=UPI0039E3D9E6
MAEYTVAHRTVEADMSGRVADTAKAAFVETVLEQAETTMRALGLDPTAPILTRIDFRTVTEGSSPISASSIQNSGGFSLALAGTRFSEVTVVPGCFPTTTERDTGSRKGEFALAEITSAALIGARDDLLRRHDLPAFDGEVVAFAVGSAPGAHRGEGPVLRLQVGSGRSEALAVYSPAGRFLRASRY